MAFLVEAFVVKEPLPEAALVAAMVTGLSSVVTTVVVAGPPPSAVAAVVSGPSHGAPALMRALGTRILLEARPDAPAPWGRGAFLAGTGSARASNIGEGDS